MGTNRGVAHPTAGESSRKAFFPRETLPASAGSGYGVAAFALYSGAARRHDEPVRDVPDRRRRIANCNSKYGASRSDDTRNRVTAGENGRTMHQ